MDRRPTSGRRIVAPSSRAIRAAILLALVVLALACNLPPLRSTVTPTAVPSPTPSLAPSGPSPTPTLPLSWEMLTPGLELRAAYIALPESSPMEVVLVRVDPTYFTWRVHYAPDDPAPVSTWQARTGATLLVNGGFFDPEYRTVGLLVADGQPYGTSFVGRGGMLGLSGQTIILRSLITSPYRPGEPLDQAVQGLPMLLEPGRLPADFDLPARPSRRTVVALEPAGRLIFLIVNDFSISLYRLRDWLVTTDQLDLDVALNLDGGKSSGLALQTQRRLLLIDSIDPVPSVIGIYPRP